MLKTPAIFKERSEATWHFDSQIVWTCEVIRFRTCLVEWFIQFLIWVSERTLAVSAAAVSLWAVIILTILSINERRAICHHLFITSYNDFWDFLIITVWAYLSWIRKWPSFQQMLIIRQSTLIIRELIVLRKLKEMWSWSGALYDSLLAKIEQMSLYNTLSEISSLLEKVSAAD